MDTDDLRGNRASPPKSPLLQTTPRARYRDGSLGRDRSPDRHEDQNVRRELERPYDRSQRSESETRTIRNPSSRHRSRDRSRSRLRDRSVDDDRATSVRDMEEQLQMEKRRVEILQSQLERERKRRQSSERPQRRESLQQERRSASRERGSGYEPTSVFLEALVNLFKNRSGERDTFPVLNNVLPEFDPLCREQTVSTWINKIDECAEMYGWNDKQTIHYALPKLVGQAKLWYHGLSSFKRTWSEWKILLTESFPSIENYAELLTEMLNKRTRFGEPLELYYYAKINLLNRCKIYGKQAVDCVVHGIDDRGIRLGAQAAKFHRPEEVLEFLKTVQNPSKDSSEIGKDKQFPALGYSRATSSRAETGTDDQSKPRHRSDSVTCYNCKEVGHVSFKCPKPIIRCNFCKLIGHKITQCPIKAGQQSDPKEKNVLKVSIDENDLVVESE